jgi:hypothetical protein
MPETPHSSRTTISRALRPLRLVAETTRMRKHQLQAASRHRTNRARSVTFAAKGLGPARNPARVDRRVRNPWNVRIEETVRHPAILIFNRRLSFRAREGDLRQE